MEDGVDIVLPDNLPSDDDKSLMNQTLGTSVYSESESSETQSFTFEIQVDLRRMICSNLFNSHMLKTLHAFKLFPLSELYNTSDLNSIC